MRRLWHVALHDLRLHVAEKSNVFFLFLMPMGFIFFFAMVNQGAKGPEEVRVSLPIVDRDGGFLAVALAEQLRGENFETRVYTGEEADTTAIRSRFIEIPDSFTARVLAGTETTVALRAPASSNVSYDFAAEIRLHLAQVRFLGNLLRWVERRDSVATSDPAEVDPAEMGRFLALVSEPSQVTVQSEYAGRGRPVPVGTQQSIPGVMVMFVVMTVLIGGSEALTQEKEFGTLRRLASTPLSRVQVLLGKTLGLTLLGLTQALVLIVATEVLSRFGLLGLDFIWSRHLVGLVPLLVVYCACVAALGIVLGGLFRTRQQSESLAWLVGMALSGLGGAWWPLEIVPDTMQVVGRFSPTSWAMDGLHSLITFGHGLSSLTVPLLVLTGMTVVFWAIGTRTLRFTD